MSTEDRLRSAVKNIQHMLKQEQTLHTMDILKDYVDRIIRRDEEERKDASAEV